MPFSLKRNGSFLGVSVLVLILLASAPSAAQEAPKQAEQPAAAPAKAPVQLDGKTLFEVRERVASFSPEERARAITEKLARLSRDPLLRADAITTADDELTTDIVAGDLVLMVVTERDAKAAGKPRQELAAEYAQVIRDAVLARQREYSLRSILLGVLYMLLATVALVLVFRFMNFLFPKIYGLLERWRGTVIPSIRIQQLELLAATRLTDMLLGLVRVVRFVLVVALLYFYLPLVLSFFPRTQGYAAVLFGYVLTPLRTAWAGFTAFLPDAIFIGVIVLVFYYLIKLVKFLFGEVGKGTLTVPGFDAEWAEPTYKIVRFLLIAFAAVVIFPYLPGSQSPAFQGVSLFLGVLFSLGSTSAIANIVAGVLLTYTRAFQVGDRVKIGETVGDVMEKTLLVTRVRTIKNVDVAVPNSMVLGSHIVNYSSSAQSHGLILHTGVTIGYDAPWRQVHELLISAADATQNILKDPKPFVLQTSLDDFYVSYELNAFTDQPATMARTYSELHQHIQDKFNEAGVEIMSPHYGALRDGNQVTIPAENLPKNYQAPSFRVLPWEPPKSNKPE